MDVKQLKSKLEGLPEDSEIIIMLTDFVGLGEYGVCEVVSDDTRVWLMSVLDEDDEDDEVEKINTT